jgi:hypothetical protein
MWQRLGLSMAGMSEPRLQTVSLPSGTWAAYEKIELTIDISGQVDAPFRSSRFAVDAAFTTPTGAVMRVPAFFDGTRWLVRFAGPEPGDYKSEIALTINGRETQRMDGPVFTLGSGGQGFVRRSKLSRYFEFDDGSAYLPVGQNVAFTSRVSRSIPVWPGHDRFVPAQAPELPWDEAYARWFGRMGAAGANWARIWMSGPDFDLLDGGPWEFNTEHAKRLDQVFELAQLNGIRICLCGDHFRAVFHPEETIATLNFFSARDRAWGRLLREEGGRIHEDIFTSAAIQELWHDTLRYQVARWGYSTNLFCWELWNEIECLVHLSNPAHVDWVRRATQRLRELDPWRHLIKSSAHLPKSVPMRGAEFGDIDDVHVYFGWTGTETAKDLAALVERCSAPLLSADRPFLFGEIGLAREVDTPEYGLVADLADRDTDGVSLHEGLWAGLFVGGCATAMSWWWDEHVDLHDQYRHFRGIVEFARDIPWNNDDIVPARCACGNWDLRAWELRGKSVRLLWVQSLHYTWWNVIHGARLSPLKGWVTLSDVPPGIYTIEWWNTESGEIIGHDEAKAEGDTLNILTPDIRKDAAAKLRLLGTE